MKSLLEFLIKEIVSDPKEIEISESEVNGVHQLTIKAPKPLIGVIIGQQGKTIKAIKTLLATKSKGQVFEVEVLEK
ncbi:MAG: KH domain-containing protein [Patescibacteria group bacterium]